MSCKAVAIVGFSKRSNSYAYDLPPGMELWTLNHGHMHGYQKIDRLYDLHPLELIRDPHFYTRDYQIGHKEFLEAQHDFPVYMIEHYPDIPASVAYPLQDALTLAGDFLHFTSSFCYMMAHAILEDYQTVWALGFDMDYGTEYEYQREEALKWIAFARGLGLSVFVPPESGLSTKRLLYGYEGVPMIGRQLIEVHQKQYEREQQKSLDQMNQWNGILSERQSQGASRRKIQEASEMILGFSRQSAMNEGAAKALAFLIETSRPERSVPGPYQLNTCIGGDG